MRQPEADVNEPRGAVAETDVASLGQDMVA